MEPKITNYRDDPRVKENHFILSEINAYFLKNYGISGTVEDFKAKVRKSRYAFKVVTGNTAHKTQHTKVYDIYEFIGKQPEIVYKLDELSTRLTLSMKENPDILELARTTYLLINILKNHFKRK